jgi:hypothetical protein
MFYRVSKPTAPTPRAEGDDHAMTRILGPLLGALLVLIGAVWTGQGAGVLPGSVMTGSRFWLVVGIVCVVAGAALLWRALRGRAAR